MNISELHKLYADVEIGDLTSRQKDQMLDFLKDATVDDISSIEEHKMYLEVLQKLRMATLQDMSRAGNGFLDTLNSLLAVGEDGVYSNSQRFLYELIQNVDDCEYESIDNCQLNIQFKHNVSPGQIVLTYNEKGFSPKNVFAITGIAEKSKNVAVDKAEIGEKGIGFKSVFGIADKVRIESGKYSFELHSKNFTVPVPRYDNFTPIEGTRLTLEMSAQKVFKIFQKFVNQYYNTDSVLNQNPILFLNKITHLKLFFDGNRYIDFNVDRKTPTMVGEIAFEEDINVKDRWDGRDRCRNDKISCKRYTMPIVYGKNECLSRYGKEAAFEEKHHNLIAVFPNRSDLPQNFNGILYSFLPTQIRLNAPVILHVPFKLDGSREFVDPQGNNQWFNYTIEKISAFLKQIYVHLATVEKENVILYLPYKNKDFFKKDNEKISCLICDDLKGESIVKEKVFYTIDGTFENADSVISFAKEDEVENPKYVFTLLECKKKLFIPKYKIDMRNYGVEEIKEVSSKLFDSGLKSDLIFDDVLNYLEKNYDKFNYSNHLSNCDSVTFTDRHLATICKHKKFYKVLKDYAFEEIENYNYPEIYFSWDYENASEEFSTKILNLVQDVDLDDCYKNYLEGIDYNFILLDNVKEDFVIPGEDAIVLSKKTPLDGFVELTSNFDDQGIFSSRLKIQLASERLDNAPEDMPINDYMNILREVRKTVKGVLGDKGYNSYIKLINESGKDKNRFINELLQNADDCIYDENVTPEFRLKISDKTVTVSYNEKGFTKTNVRAITAIGESTKKSLLDDSDNSIGEKGVGFKSVFAVADSVEIHSNGFDFKLDAKTPTIPEKCKTLSDGSDKITTMIFSMKSVPKKAFDEEYILKLCLCLRKLKKIYIDNIKILIEDHKDKRVISIGSKKYTFDKFVYDFVIYDDEAVEERTANQQSVNRQQYVNFYIPNEAKWEEYPLYVGLPTSVSCYAPMIIDAPFMLTTSRDDVIEGRWNELVREAIYEGIVSYMNQVKEKLRIDIFKYVKYSSRNYEDKVCTFSDDYLNDYDWLSMLSDEELLPVLGKNEFVFADEYCSLVPDVIAYIAKKIDVSEYFENVIIDTYRKGQYNPLLEYLDCEKSELAENLGCIKAAASQMMSDDTFRKYLYTYLASSDTIAEVEYEDFLDDIKELPIIPIRTKTGIEYVKYSDNIYTHDTKVSDSEFLILEQNILDYEKLQNILCGEVRINELTDEVYAARYQKRLLEILLDTDEDGKHKAIYMLNEYKNNFDSFRECIPSLRGYLNDLYFEMLSGDYCFGKKYINSKRITFLGSFVNDLVVADDFSSLGMLLGCTDITEIHYDDIDTDLKEVSDEDIYDIQNEFKHNFEILSGLIQDGIISEELIIKFNLEYLCIDSVDDEDDEYEDFPEKEVADIKRIKNRINNKLNNNPNRIVIHERKVREPEFEVNNKAYTVGMYGSEINPKKCFCQMCEKKVSVRYIERNSVQKEPNFGWDQMYLSLCLKCSKDYTLLRNNKQVWFDFIENIKNADVEGEENMTIEIGNKTIRFTGTHLAEIQAIIEAEEKLSQ